MESAGTPPVEYRGDTPETGVPLPDMVAGEAIVADTAPIVGESHSELDAQVPTFDEAGAQLLKAARQATHGDSIDRQFQLFPKIFINGMAAVGGILSVAPAITIGSREPIIAGVAMAAAGVGGAVSLAISASRAKSIEIDDGYRLQCLRADKPVDTMQQGEVAVALLNNRYEDGVEEPLPFAKKRLADALDTVAAAVAQDTKKTFSHMLIPVKEAYRAGLPVQVNGLEYGGIVGLMKMPRTWSPYPDGTAVMSVPVERAAQLAEIARSDPDALLQRVFEKLGADGRFAGKREALFAENAAIVRILHGMLLQTVSEDSGVRQKERVMTRVAVNRRKDGELALDADGKPIVDIHDVWTGEWRTDSEDIYTHVDTSSKYNPHIHKQTTTTNRQLENYNLRSKTGDSTTLLADATRKLEADMYDNLQLIRIALQLLENKEQVACMDEQALADLPHGEPRIGFALARRQEKRHAWRERFRYAGRVAVAAAALALSADAVDKIGFDAPDLPDFGSSTGAFPSSLGKPLWRVEDHNLDNPNPYWRQFAQYTFSNGEWQDTSRYRDFSDSLPAQLPDPDVPHKTVSSVFDGPQTWLPIQEGTKVAAVRLTNLASHKPAGVGEALTSDGNVFIHATGDDTYSYFKVEYDLVAAGKGEGFNPQSPITIDQRPADKPDPTRYPGHFDPSGYISTMFTYDNGDGLKDLVSGNTAKEYVDNIYKRQRCQCLQCNTVAAILEAGQHPNQNMAVIGGYLDPVTPAEEAAGYDYLTEDQGHAWLNEGTGNDATPAKTDENSHINNTQGKETSDALWQRQQKDGHVAAVRFNLSTGKESVHLDRLNIPWRKGLAPLAGLALLGAGALEVRKKYMQQAVGHAIRVGNWVVAAQAIDPRDAVRLMDWHEYAPARSQMPALSKHAYRGEQPHSISSGALDDIAKGGFRGNDQLNGRQQRGMRRTARAIRRERRMTGRA